VGEGWLAIFFGWLAAGCCSWARVRTGKGGPAAASAGAGLLPSRERRGRSGPQTGELARKKKGRERENKRFPFLFKSHFQTSNQTVLNFEQNHSSHKHICSSMNAQPSF